MNDQTRPRYFDTFKILFLKKCHKKFEVRKYFNYSVSGTLINNWKEKICAAARTANSLSPVFPT